MIHTKKYLKCRKNGWMSRHPSRKKESLLIAAIKNQLPFPNISVDIWPIKTIVMATWSELLVLTIEQVRILRSLQPKLWIRQSTVGLRQPNIPIPASEVCRQKRYDWSNKTIFPVFTVKILVVILTTIPWLIFITKLWSRNCRQVTTNFYSGVAGRGTATKGTGDREHYTSHRKPSRSTDHL